MSEKVAFCRDSLYDLHFFANSDDESSIRVVFEVELIHEVRHELEESASPFSEVSFESDGCFGFFELFHLTTGLGIGSSSRIADLHVYREDSICCFEVYGEVVFIEREASVLDGIVHKLIRDEHETVLPWDLDVVLLEEEEDEITDDLRLVVICFENELQIKTPKIDNVFIHEID